ncbi:mannosyltransferase family protein [Curtobacterium sp. MCBD17_003]|uniref:mannosyltransferase family protein n=1 Tax=Curtobacterium sp. MCBD17_003 TaxID=2175667 RepID=UPI000DAA570A|nr:mannosyltransferase family protein [Curtobacterium sp. MCBD17_003]WIE53763.1 mannosyltransferase family protein [Curtobacterium sp. MCBD17_003]
MRGPDELERPARPAAVSVVARPSRNRLADLAVSTPGWAAILVLFAASRMLSTTWLALVYPLIVRAQPANAIRGNDHGFLTFLTSWDGQYYEDISLHGYPSVLPTDALGHVMQNNWAFLPAFPFTIRMLTASTGLPFRIGAPLIATIAGLVAAYLLHALVRERAGGTAALWAVFFFCLGPLSFLLEVGYAESMFLALVFGALLAMQRRRYLPLTLLSVVAAFTRPGELAIPLTLGVVALVRYVRDRGSFPVRERLTVIGTGLVTAAAGVAWPVIASHATGRPNAYLDTEMSWWVNFIGRVHFVPLSPWFLTAARWVGVGGVLLVIAMAVAYGVWLSRRSTRELGLVTVVFAAAYALYVFAVSIPMASTPRLLMPLAPLTGSPELVARPWARWIMVSGALVGQPVLIAVLWLMGPP